MPTVTVKGQVTIPKRIREAMGIEPGMEVKFELENDKCVLKKHVEEYPFDEWAGFLGVSKSTDELKNEQCLEEAYQEYYAHAEDDLKIVRNMRIAQMRVFEKSHQEKD